MVATWQGLQSVWWWRAGCTRLPLCCPWVACPYAPATAAKASCLPNWAVHLYPHPDPAARLFWDLQWYEKWWEVSDWKGMKEMGAEKWGCNARGAPAAPAVVV